MQHALNQSILSKIVNKERIHKFVLHQGRHNLIALFSQLSNDSWNIEILKF